MDCPAVRVSEFIYSGYPNESIDYELLMKYVKAWRPDSQEIQSWDDLEEMTR